MIEYNHFLFLQALINVRSLTWPIFSIFISLPVYHKQTGYLHAGYTIYHG